MVVFEELLGAGEMVAGKSLFGAGRKLLRPACRLALVPEGKPDRNGSDEDRGEDDRDEIPSLRAVAAAAAAAFMVCLRRCSDNSATPETSSRRLI